jgi:hypothetical protein
MGWLLKGLALVVGLVSLTLMLWPVSLVCFGYLAYSLWRSTHKRTVYVKDGGRRQPREAPSVKKAAFKRRYVAAGFFFLLALVALAGGGTFSPFVFALFGVLIVLSGVTGFGPSMSEVREVPDSILLKSRWFPFSWVSIAEVKFGSQQMTKPLSSVGSEVIMTVSSEKLSVYLPIRVFALSVASAESKVAEKLAPIARMLSAKEAYTLPLESRDAAKRMDWKLKPVGLALEYGNDGVASLNSTPFDVLVLAPSGHLLESAAAYVASPNAKPGRFRVPGKGRKLENQPLLWEALETLAEKHAPPHADAVTSFLSSVCATRGESLGDRLENGGQTGSGTVLVSSLGSVQVELTRPQLKAIVMAYG